LILERQAPAALRRLIHQLIRTIALSFLEIIIRIIMQTSRRFQNLFVKHIALPQDHGSWVFLFSPLLIGLFASASWSKASLILVFAALSAFLIRQPVTILVKVYSGRRAQRDLPAAWFWTITYSIIGLVCLSALVWLGYDYLLLLMIPGIPVFIWHLYLVRRRAERRQILVEVLGSGVLTLVAPAAFWVGEGWPNPTGWLLFLLVWLQSAASIVYAYLRLGQRTLTELPERSAQFKMGKWAILSTTFNVIFVSGLAVFKFVPWLLPLPYIIQWLETIWGVFHPAISVKPVQIGIRQLIFSTVFTIVFILVWSLLPS
jgi:hypothetical protein